MKLFFHAVIAIGVTSLSAVAEQRSAPAQLQARSVACPVEWVQNLEDAPVCPESGVISETYPTAALVVSDSAYRNSGTKFFEAGRESNFTADVVMEALTNAGKRLPVIILPVEDETMNVIRNRIANLQVPQETKDRYLQSLRHVPRNSGGYTWQQDFMQSFVNPQTGLPMMRNVAGYAKSRSMTDPYDQSLINQFDMCGIENGPPLTSLGEVTSGNYGGNIEALPGGICVLGNDHMKVDQWNHYIKQVCPNSTAETQLKPPTDWLVVGHADEIMKTVRNNSKPEPCNFSVVIASPNKALELLEQNPDAPFADFTGGRGGTRTELENRRYADYEGLATLCDKILNPPSEVPGSPDTTPSPESTPTQGNGRGVSFNLQMLFGSDAQATAEEVLNCRQLSNGQVARYLRGDNMMAHYNRLIQQQMTNLRRDVISKVSRRIPGCTPDIIEAPDLFFGGSPVRQDDGTYKLPVNPGRGASLLPNPTNAISVNNAIISPEPGNAAFKTYLQGEYSKRGLNPRFVDTFDYAHQGYGNLHCSTNTLHVCTPRGSR